MRQICSMKLDDDDDIKVHVGLMRDLFLKLHNLGENSFNEKWNIAMLLSSLPNSYNNLITAFESRTEEELTIGYVESKLIEEYVRRKGDKADTQKAMVIANKKHNASMECFFCHKKGHMKKNCIRYNEWKKKQQQKVNKIANDDFCLIAAKGNSCFIATDGFGKWIVDSGASCHICNDEKSFIKLNRNISKQICLANDEKVVSSGEGAVKIKLKRNDNVYNNITLKNLLYVPEINNNILSVKQLTEKGCHIDFNNDKCVVRKDSVVVFWQ